MRLLAEWEQRSTVAARNPRNAHRRLGREQHLEEILSVRVARRVAQDHTVSWDGNRWGVLREEVCAGLRGAAVEIERRLDGSHWLRYRGRYLHLRACPEAVRPSARDRKSTRLNSSHRCISYAVFCLKKKKKKKKKKANNIRTILKKNASK